MAGGKEDSVSGSRGASGRDRERRGVERAAGAMAPVASFPGGPEDRSAASLAAQEAWPHTEPGAEIDVEETLGDDPPDQPAITPKRG